MREYDSVYPHYGFARHVGYGTREHWAALREHGCCPIHRRSFRGVIQEDEGAEEEVTEEERVALEERDEKVTGEASEPTAT